MSEIFLTLSLLFFSFFPFILFLFLLFASFLPFFVSCLRTHVDTGFKTGLSAIGLSPNIVMRVELRLASLLYVSHGFFPCGCQNTVVVYDLLFVCVYRIVIIKFFSPLISSTSPLCLRSKGELGIAMGPMI